MAHITTFQGVEKFVNQADVRSAMAGEAIAKRRFCVKLSSGELIKTTADTDIAVGLSWDSYADGVHAQYIIRGDLQFIATGNIAVGDPLCPDNATPGNMRTAVSGDRVFGYAIDVAETGEYCYGRFDFINHHLLA
jgi:hypothetical protein